MYTLNDICLVITDGSHYSPEDEGVGYPMLSVKDMGESDFDFSKCKYIGEEAFHKLMTNGCKPEVNDVVVAKDGSYLKTAFTIREDRDLVLLSSIAILRPKLEIVLPDYLSYFLKAPSVYRTVSLNYISGTALKRVILKGIKKIPIELPTLEKQQDRVMLLDMLCGIIQKRRYQLYQFDKLIRARFVEMFGDFKINSMGWPIVGFEEIATIDGNMTTDYEKYADYPHIGIDSIEKETGLLKGYRTVAEDGVISGKYVFTPAHIIYSKIRPNLNKVALPDFEGLCSADAYPILPIEGKCNRVFLAYDMRSTFFLDYILQFCNRTNLPKVNRKEVAGFKTPLPPLELQNEFADFVCQVDKSKAQVQKSLNETQLLFDSLMQKYFG